MQYIMLIYLNEKSFAGLTKEEQTAIHADCGTWHDALVKSGRSVGCSALQPSFTATTIRAPGGKVTVTDGPFAETKEVLGGFEILECQDLDEALAIAGRFPALRANSAVEVRPLVNAEQTCEMWDEAAPSQ